MSSLGGVWKRVAVDVRSITLAGKDLAVDEGSLTVAGKEFDDAVRSQALWVLGVVAVGALLGTTVGYAWVSPRPTVTTLLAYLIELLTWLVPVTALVVGYDAVVGEREAGTLRLLFGFPYSRGQVLFGKFLGRFVAVIAPVSAGLLASFLLTIPLYGGPRPGEYAVLLVTTVLLAAAFVSIAVAISALARSAVRVVAIAVGVFVAFLFVWDLVPATLHALLVGGVPGAQTPPAWYYLVERLNPVESFHAVFSSAYPWLAGATGSGGPFYLDGWFALLLLVGWIVVPFGVALVRFRGADLA